MSTNELVAGNCGGAGTYFTGSTGQARTLGIVGLGIRA